MHSHAYTHTYTHALTRVHIHARTQTLGIANDVVGNGSQALLRLQHLPIHSQRVISGRTCARTCASVCLCVFVLVSVCVSASESVSESASVSVYRCVRVLHTTLQFFTPNLSSHTPGQTGPDVSYTGVYSLRQILFERERE